MTNFNNVDEILNYAIDLEQKAVDLYTDLATKAKNENTKEVFLSYANEERGHKARLQSVKGGKKQLPPDEKVQDLKISDYAVTVKLSSTPSYQDVLLFAMDQEKQAFKLYNDLAARSDDKDLEELFLGLAQEEAKHKLKFEIEYDENVLTEN